jgi:hypothetical protein
MEVIFVIIRPVIMCVHLRLSLKANLFPVLLHVTPVTELYGILRY